MTTYVLHGGETSIDSPKNDEFFKLFVDLVPKEEIKILMCYWARPREEWNMLVKRDSEKVLRQTKRRVNFSLVENPTDLFKKLPQSDVLFVAGGDAPPLERYYADLKGLGKVLAGKVYLGSSMGAFLASKKYVLSLDSQDTGTVHDGVGLLPIKVLVHWDKEEEKERKLGLLKAVDPTTPIFVLDEQQYVVLYE